MRGVGFDHCRARGVVRAVAVAFEVAVVVLLLFVCSSKTRKEKAAVEKAAVGSCVHCVKGAARAEKTVQWA